MIFYPAISKGFVENSQNSYGSLRLDDDNWIFVADDSSPEGRRLKPQLIGSFSEENSDRSVSVCKFDSVLDDEEIPASFLCPITRDIMKNPVVAAGLYY